MTARRTRILDAIEGLKQLAPGWDGHGAAAIDPLLCDAARWLVERLPEQCVIGCRVHLMPDGALWLEWGGVDRGLELEFETPHRVRYLKCSPDAPEEGTLLLTLNIAEIVDLVRWCAGTDKP